MIFKIRTMGKACVQEKYLENIGHERGQPSGSKNKEHREASKEGKNRWRIRR